MGCVCVCVCVSGDPLPFLDSQRCNALQSERTRSGRTKGQVRVAEGGDEDGWLKTKKVEDEDEEDGDEDSWWRG